ncbi:hypothetical protein C5E45_19325 [Nocardia nova]|uniref:Mammalian cell entry protein n=1 Tax=Nocardia nova TaxID=37330 RepID=A0A2S6AMY3_9NOCA|nr:hypothetical protein [Nocardia nova]PPJ25801.1 hypothetical protein C5E41_19205 [Nocardia nova]PPJ36569.1 hypothetical protein C5E45_19325 [Nocardia nova]
MADDDDADGSVTGAPAGTAEPTAADSAAVADDVAGETTSSPSGAEQSTARRRLSRRILHAGKRIRAVRPRTIALAAAAAVPLVVVGVAAWQWKDLSDLHHDDSERAAYLSTARQGALNLTTIRWDNADSDVQRILDGSGGKFHDDFASRSASFVAVVKQAKSTSQGEITEAGIESVDHDTAHVIVAANVKTTHVDGGAGGGNQDPQAWRLRMTVHRTADRMLVTDVEFVP